jgi:hypothetical protein
MLILNSIQQKLKVPKQSNPNVKYKSRSAEDIIEMVKPLLGNAILTISDELVLVGERYYIKATATIQESDESMSATAYAREEEKPQFMSVAQGTGSTSSYARKYALNGLLLIDDTQDDDTREYVEPKKLSLPEQISELIQRALHINALEEITKKVESSTKLTDNQKDVLMAEINFKAEDLSDELTK